MKVLMVLTSHDQLGNTGRKTGFWLEEMAAPYYVFKDAGAQITLASPKGGRPPLDPKSNEPNFRTDITRRFEKDADAEAQLDRTVRLDSVKQEDYDTVFYPGGHGPMWDLVDDKNSIKLPESFLAAGKTFAVVCHSSGALRHVKTPDGKLLVAGKTVTGFTNGEEDEVGLTKVVPFLVEDELMRLGATFSKVKDWGVHTVADGQLITGVNGGVKAGHWGGAKTGQFCGVGIEHDAPRPPRRRWPGFRSRGGRGFQEARMISPISGSAAAATSSGGRGSRRRLAFDCLSR